MKSFKTHLYLKSSAPINSKQIVIKQEWSKSKDGTKVPMFLVHKKGLKLNKNTPAVVYGYGGFGTALTPHYTSSIIPFINDGGIYIQANIRGGSEFGEKWHISATKNKKHKSFEDFASILDYLSQNQYTNPNKIVIWGGSNGGLLMSVMMLRYQSLFHAALINVPVTDMLRFHLFNGGRWWIDDYGNPDDKKMRKYLLSYSPYHNVKKLNYPTAMFATSNHDDRVHPMHSYKMVARLKENKNQNNPIILRIEKGAGHSGGSKISSTINRLVDEFSFIYKELGI